MIRLAPCTFQQGKFCRSRLRGQGSFTRCTYLTHGLEFKETCDGIRGISLALTCIVICVHMRLIFYHAEARYFLSERLGFLGIARIWRHETEPRTIYTAYEDSVGIFVRTVRIRCAAETNSFLERKFVHDPHSNCFRCGMLFPAFCIL